MTSLSDLITEASQQQRDCLRAEQVQKDLIDAGIVRRRCECGALLNKQTPPKCPECGKDTSVESQA